MNLVELPREVLLVIWSFITRAEDILRLGSSCKKIHSLAFEVARDLHIPDFTPIAVIKHLLSHDLRHLRKLSLPLTDPNELDWIIDRMTVLTACYNLTELSCYQIGFDEYIKTRFISRYPRIRQIYQQMTWLESIKGHFPRTENFGDLFKDHQRLTQLHPLITVVASEDKSKLDLGLDKLKQVRSFKFPIQTSEDREFYKVLQMENLTELCIDYIVVGDGSEITRLTNLEKISAVDCFQSNSFIRYETIPKFPKLRELRVQIDEAIKEEHLPCLTQLTSLALRRSEKETPQKFINYLPNIQSLGLEFICDGLLDFSELKKLTHLTIHSTTDNVHQIQLPKALKSLIIKKCKTEFMEGILNTPSLQQLTLWNWPYRTEKLPDKILEMSRLTNLKYLYVHELPNNTKFIQALASLPMLGELQLNAVREEDINSLKLLTQLCQLTVREIGFALKEKRKQLPFILFKQTEL